jgi:hypothetical protein
MTKLRDDEVMGCPFCGCDVCYVAPMILFKTSRVRCPECDCGGPECFTYAKAVAAWNRRASDVYAPTEAGLKAMRGES